MTEPTTSFADSGEAVISRKIDVSPDISASSLSTSEFAEYYDVERTVDEIIKGGYKCVALQFPDELLRNSVPVFKALRSRLEEEICLYTLADTSYGSCCVDEVASRHVNADVVVHYGHACLSQTSQIPVIYVFGRKPIDVSNCVTELADSIRDSPRACAAERICMRYDVVYSHRATEIAEQLHATLGRPVHHSEIPLKAEPLGQPAHNVGENLRLGATDQATDVLLYVGSESLSLTNLLVTHGASEIHSYDPVTRQARIESHVTNKLLMRRYAVVQKARDADVFGILVGTLGVAAYLPLISRIRKLLTQARKKSYTISVGKLNPSKLANFLEIECFILVACPENSLVDSKEFFKPIITPFELEIAIGVDSSWTGEYILDFGRLLDRDVDLAAGVGDDEDEQLPEFSLVTGQYRKAKRFGGMPSPISGETSSAIALRNDESALSVLGDSAAAQFLQNRTYRGLETRVGEDMPSMLEQGRSGVARGYSDDHRPT